MNRSERLDHYGGIALAHIIANPHTAFVGTTPIIDPATGIADHNLIASMSWSVALAMDRQRPDLK